jgi:hypothetical protein
MLLGSHVTKVINVINDLNGGGLTHLSRSLARLCLYSLTINLCHALQSQICVGFV